MSNRKARRAGLQAGGAGGGDQKAAAATAGAKSPTGKSAAVQGRAAWYDQSSASVQSAAAGAPTTAATASEAGSSAAGASVRVGSGNSGGATKYVGHTVKKPFLIGVTGGTASGKTTVCQSIIEQLDIPWVVCLSMDSFYRPLTPTELKNASNHNFDHPDSFDWITMRKCLKDIRAMKSVQIPRYDFKTHSRLPQTDRVYGADVVLVEGILVLHDKEIRDLFDMKIFVDTDSDLRLVRRCMFCDAAMRCLCYWCLTSCDMVCCVVLCSEARYRRARSNGGWCTAPVHSDGEAVI